MDARVEYQVTKEDEGMTLGRLARSRMAVSASLLRQLKRTERGILLDGEEVYVNVLPRAGQVISLASGRAARSEGIIPEDGPVDIAYEDELMMIVDKPGGMAVHPIGPMPRGTLANYVMGLYEKRGETRVFHAINRLDRGTSGLLCIAKNRYAAGLLDRALWEGRLRRDYLAVCDGVPEPPDGTIDLPIGRAEGFGIKRAVRPDGQRAVTHYRTLHTQGGRSLLLLTLDTGRTHQIRVHLSHIGCPLTGDFMYGTELPDLGRFCLHSCRLRLELPDRALDVRSAMPASFRRFVDFEPEMCYNTER